VNSTVWQAVPWVGGTAGGTALVLLVSNRRARAAVSAAFWSTAVWLLTAPAQDDVVTPAGGEEPPEEATALELEAVASALRECGDEVRGGCDCEDCTYIRDVLIAIYGRVSGADRDLLDAHGITWDREVAS